MVSFDKEKIKSNFKTLGVWMYWIIGTVIIGTISYILYTRFNKQVAAILVFLVSMLALYYYYVKWIVIPGWQPHIGTCPDFMTSLGLLNNSSKQFVCSDTLNVYNTGTDALILTRNGFDGNETAKTALGSEAAGNVSSAFGLVLTPTINENTSTDVIKGFCGRLKEAKISWINLCEM
jgi:hypothetical protein